MQLYALARHLLPLEIDCEIKKNLLNHYLNGCFKKSIMKTYQVNDTHTKSHARLR